jgi:CRISPR-associated endonuclease/helicase Cas3
MLIANTSKQSLVNHSIATGHIAKYIIETIYNDNKLANVAFISGCLHDLGKIDETFQTWANKTSKKKLNFATPESGEHIEEKKFSFEKYPRHNEISLLLTYLLMDEDNKTVNKNNKKSLLHSIYWSHAKPIRKEDFKNLAFVYNLFKNNSLDNLNSLIEKTKSFIKELDTLTDIGLSLSEIFGCTDIDEKINELNETKLPDYKTYHESNMDVESYLKDVIVNSNNNIIRSAVISADRLVSSISSSKLDYIVTNKTFNSLFDESIKSDYNLLNDIKVCIDGFNTKFPGSERNIKQNEASNSLVRHSDISILSGAAGIGKTKIALEWAMKTNAKKIFWICPRVAICQSIFSDLKQSEYLPNTAIELSTGEYQITSRNGIDYDTIEVFSGHIVITTIDQVISSIITHRDITKFVDFMSSHAVFDEFHEYINMSAFNLLFAELIRSKKNAVNKNTLLVSATPNHYFVEKFLEIDLNSIVSVESFNESKYKIEPVFFDEEQDVSNPFFKKQEKGSINISNTASTAQNSFIDNHTEENCLLYHSKYTKSDKAKYFEEMLNCFSQKGNKKYDSLRSGPGVSASLNITCERMLSEFNNAENTLQRMGRLGRFGENNISVFKVAVPKEVAEKRRDGGCLRFLGQQHILSSSLVWHEFLKENIYGKEMNLKEIYNLYSEFYKKESNILAIEEDFLRALKESTKNINRNVVDPLCLPNKSKTVDDKIKIKKNSLRGDNRFVQMAVCEVASRLPENIKYLNEYAYPENSTNGDLTLTYMKITGYGNSEKNLLSFMLKKHHNIKEGYTKAYNDNHLINMARDPEFPVYVSYTPEDLLKVNSEAHNFAVYYVKTKKQSVGAIGINKLQKM